MGKVEGRDNFGEDPKFFIGVEVERSPIIWYENFVCYRQTKSQKRYYKDV